MPYSPEDIVAYEFRPKTRGYDRDEVDGFLDALADQIEEAAKEQEAARAQLAALEAQLAEARQSESALKRAFITVQEASDRALAEAQEEVARLREEVAKELEELRERASRDAMATQLRAEDEARGLVETAENTSRDLVESAERAAAEQRQRVAELQQIDADHRQRLRDHLEAQLAALQSLPDPFTALTAELSPPPAPQAWEQGDGGIHDTTATAPDDAAHDPWTSGDHREDGSSSGEDPDLDAEPATSIEEEVASRADRDQRRITPSSPRSMGSRRPPEPGGPRSRAPRGRRRRSAPGGELGVELVGVTETTSSMRSSSASPAALRWSLTARTSSRAAPSTSSSRVSAVSSANEVLPSWRPPTRSAGSRPPRPSRGDGHRRRRRPSDVAPHRRVERAATSAAEASASSACRSPPRPAGALLERRPERAEVRLERRSTRSPVPSESSTALTFSSSAMSSVSGSAARRARRGHGDQRPRQRLAHLHRAVVAGLPAELDHPAAVAIAAAQLVVAPGGVGDGEVGQVHRGVHRRRRAPGRPPGPATAARPGTGERREQLRRVVRQVCRVWYAAALSAGSSAGAPSRTAAVAAHVPVRQVVDEPLERAGRGGHVVALERASTVSTRSASSASTHRSIAGRSATGGAGGRRGRSRRSRRRW
jgi:DivIVA domain-containing protein